MLDSEKPWKNVLVGTTREEVDLARVAAHRAQQLEMRNPHRTSYVYDPRQGENIDVDGVTIHIGGRVPFNVYPPHRSVTCEQAKNPHARDAA